MGASAVVTFLREGRVVVCAFACGAMFAALEAGVGAPGEIPGQIHCKRTEPARCRKQLGTGD